MGFGGGIHKRPRRFFSPLLPHLGTFGWVTSWFWDCNVVVVSRPLGDRPRPGPFPGDRPDFPHDTDPLGVVPDTADGDPRRNLLSDARDLLLQVLFERTAQRYPLTDPRADLPIAGQSPVLPCVIEGPDTYQRGPIPAPLSGGVLIPGYIHIGRTARAEQILRDSFLRGVARGYGWDGRLESLDADGYVTYVGVRNDGALERHIIFTGGSDYAVYYAVADFLRRHAGVNWLFPGKLGTVIPRDGIFNLNESYFMVEEPDYRGRTLAAMYHTNAESLHTVEEINDLRNWFLRNKLHPHTERAHLFMQAFANTPAATTREHPNNRNCVNLDENLRKYTRVESRIPIGHNLSRFFSPHQSSFDGASLTPGVGPDRVSALPHMYPDSRPRDERARPLGRQPALNGQGWCASDQVGMTPVAPCPPSFPNLCNCPIEARFANDPLRLRAQNAQRMVLRLDTSGTCAPPRTPLSPTTVQGFEERFARAIWFREHESAPPALRFIPRTNRATHAQASAPFDRWAPCLFQTPVSATDGDENPLAKFRETVAVDLANQLIYSNVLSRWIGNGYNTEFCESLGADDGFGFWCECIPCRSTNENDGTAVVFKGFNVLANVVAFDAADQEGWISQSTEPGILLRQTVTAIQVFQRAFLELEASPVPVIALRLDLGAVFRLNALDFLDRMALRGLIPDRARLGSHTRRILVLLNRTALSLARSVQTPTTYTGPGISFFPPVTLPPFLDLDHTVLTFLTYLEFTAPPIFERDPSTEPGHFYPNTSDTETSLHPVLTPVISGSHDLFEYDDEVPLGGRSRFSVARAARPFQQQRIAPEQFLHRRWSLIARQTGIYEYMYGWGSIAPRIYTRRLRNALQGSFEDYRSRVFIAEGVPHMGLDGIKFHELAQLLWDTSRSTDAMRTEYCNALCYQPGVGLFTRAASAMKSYFDALEKIWCDRDRDEQGPPQQRFNISNFGTPFGFGTLGRIGWITELDPFMRTPAQRRNFEVPPVGSMPFDTAWQWIELAFFEARDARAVDVQGRIQYFRRTFGLIGLLIEVLQPIMALWAKVEASLSRPFPNNRRVELPFIADPLDWMRTRGAGLIDPGTVAQIAGGILGARWASALGFREDIRKPVHRYVVNTNEPSRLGRELGLGFASGPLLPLETRIPFNANASASMRHAFFLPMLQQYVDWWNIHGSLVTRTDEGAREESTSSGIGGPIFLSAKKVIGALLTAAISPVVASRAVVEPFMRDA